MRSDCTSPIIPSWMRRIASCRPCECRHMKPQPTLRFFFSDSSADLSIRRTPGESTANDFSMNTLTPFWTAYSKCSGRNAAGVVRITTSFGPRQSMADL